MISRLPVLILTLCLNQGFSQQDTARQYIPGRFTYFTTDKLQSVYMINEKDEVIKQLNDNGRVFTYSNKQLGKPTWIDAANPMKVLVFYPDFQTIVLLDSRLAQVALFRLLSTSDGQSYLPVAACSQPEDDFFWIYDQLSQSLIKLDERAYTVARSESFLQLLNVNLTEPDLYYYNQVLYLYDVSIGLMEIDRFGNPVRTIEKLPDPYYQVTRDYIIYRGDGEVGFFDRDGIDHKSLPLPDDHALQVRWEGNLLYVRSIEGIRVYEPSVSE
jgi:hypothetical protein